MFLFSGKEAYLGFYIGGSGPCSKNIGHGPIKWLLLEKKRKKKLWVHPSLIEISMNKYPPVWHKIGTE
jgi:hypothetical protein